MVLQTETALRHYERAIPHDIGAEMCVLASMMLEGSMLDEVSLIINRDDFFQADHQVIFDVLLKMRDGQVAIDAMTLRAELERRQLLEEIGGAVYIGSILNTVPSAAHGVHYANTVKEHAQVRQMITASNDILRDCYAPRESVRELMDKAEQRIFKVASTRATQSAKSMEDTLHEVFEDIENRGQRGLETGYIELDDMLNGLQNGDLLIIGARPSIGKTALALNIAEGVSSNAVTATMVFSMEMGRKALAQRMLCSHARVDSQKVRKSMLTESEFGRLADSVAQLAHIPIIIDDTPTMNVLELRAKARRAKSKNNIGLIIVDYLQLMDAATSGKENRQQQITEISRGLKATARELNVPIIALSQLNRTSETREGHRPRMSDLRESGAIEQDADVIMLLHREDYYQRTEPDFVPDNIAEVIVAKQRNGPTGVVKLHFDDRATRFDNLSTTDHVQDPF